MGIGIDAVDVALNRDLGPPSTQGDADGVTAANEAAALHHETFGIEVANNSTLYFLGTLIADGAAPANIDDAREWVNAQMQNPFPPSLAELGVSGYVDAALFVAHTRFVWAVAAGVAAVDAAAAQILELGACDAHGVPTAHIDTVAAAALRERVAMFVARCVEQRAATCTAVAST